MARTPTFNPTVDPISFQPKPVVSGVKDKGSTLSMLAGLGSLTAEGIANYQEQTAYEQLESGLSQLNEQYLQTSPTILQETAEQAAADELFMKNMPGMAGFETGEQIEQTYSQVEKSYNEKLGFLERAKQQGRLTPEEFAIRAKDITRGVVARNPHLTRELLGRLSQNLSMSGVQERMELDTAMLKSQQDAIAETNKRVRSELKERDIPETPFMVNGVLDVNAAQIFIDKERANEFIFNEAKRNAEMGETLSKQNALEVVQSGAHIAIANGFVADTRTKISSIINQGGDFNSTITSIDLVIDDQIGQLQTSFASLTNDPTIKQTIDNTVKRLEGLRTTLKASTSGANLREAYENNNAVQTIIEKQQLRAAVGNLERLDLIVKFSSSPFIGQLLRQGQTDLIVNTLGQLVKMEEGVRMGTQYLTPVPGTNTSVAELGFDIAATAIGEGNGAPSEMLNTNSSDRVDAITKTEDLDQRFIQTEKYLAQLSDPKYSAAVTSLSAETKAKSLDLITAHSKALTGRLGQLVDREGVTWQFTPDGELRVSGISRQETVDVVNRINTSLRAFAQLNGISTKAASAQYFGQIYNNVFNPEDLPNVEADYRKQAEALLPTLTKVESSNRMYESVIDPITGASTERLLLGPMTRSGERAQGMFQLMPSTMRRPGYGVTPVDFTKTGKAFEKEMKRFSTDYLTAMIGLFDGDQQKALAAYNAGPGAVQKAVQKAAAEGTPDGWLKYVPNETKNYVKQFKTAVTPQENKMGNLIGKLRQDQIKIQTSNLSQYNMLFEEGSSVALAKDIAEELSVNYGLTPTWQEVHKYMEDNNLMPQTGSSVTARFASGKLRKATNE